MIVGPPVTSPAPPARIPFSASARSARTSSALAKPSRSARPHDAPAGGGRQPGDAPSSSGQHARSQRARPPATGSEPTNSRAPSGASFARDAAKSDASTTPRPRRVILADCSDSLA